MLRLLLWLVLHWGQLQNSLSFFRRIKFGEIVLKKVLIGQTCSLFWEWCDEFVYLVCQADFSNEKMVIFDFPIYFLSHGPYDLEIELKKEKYFEGEYFSFTDYETRDILKKW